MKKLLTLLFFSFILSSCASNNKLNDDSQQFKSQTPPPAPQEEPMQTQTIESQDNQVEEPLEKSEPYQIFEVGYDSSELSKDAKEILTTQSEWLGSDKSIKVLIEGHCDERGTREYNIALGEKRANAVKEFLTSKGIDQSRIKIISYGKERPAMFGSDESSMAKNRRSVTVIEN